MVDWKIPLYKIYSDEEDLQEVSKVIKRGTYWAIGPEIEELEKRLAEYVGRDYCIVFNSGTSALHATLLAYQIGRGDTVIVPSFTFVATANSVLFVGAKPIFGDIEETTFGLDPNYIQAKITGKVKAMMPIHYGGLPCQIDELRDLAKKHKAVLIEDAAESLGSEVHGKQVGSLGDSSVFSFCANKVVTCGEGGAVLTDSKEVYEKLKLIRSHGRLDRENYFGTTSMPEYITLGYNWRMSSITAALALSQLSKIDKLISRRVKNADYMSNKLRSLDLIEVPTTPEGYSHVYQMYTIRVKSGRKARDALQKYLAGKGIMSKVYFDPVHLTYYYRKNFKHRKGELPVTERISGQVLTLPMYPSLTGEEMNYITDSIAEFFESSKDTGKIREHHHHLDRFAQLDASMT